MIITITAIRSDILRSPGLQAMADEKATRGETSGNSSVVAPETLQPWDPDLERKARRKYEDKDAVKRVLRLSSL